MDWSKLGTGQKIAGIAGVVLIVNLFLDWYSISADFGALGSISASANAFDAGFFAWGGSLIAVAGAVVLLLKPLDVADVKIGNFATEQVGLGLGALGFLLVLLRLVTETSSMAFGLWLGLVATAVVAYGGFQATRDAGLEIPGLGGSGTA